MPETMSYLPLPGETPLITTSRGADGRVRGAATWPAAVTSAGVRRHRAHPLLVAAAVVAVVAALRDDLVDQAQQSGVAPPADREAVLLARTRAGDDGEVGVGRVGQPVAHHRVVLYEHVHLARTQRAQLRH